MILYITVAAVTVLLAGMVNNRPLTQPYRTTRQQMCNRVCLLSIFLILFALSACRLNVGNDYAKYVEFMHLVNCDSYVPTEIGFNLVVKLVYGLSGFENYLLVFALYAFVTILLFLLAMYEQSDEFALTFFLFMALGYYFQTFSTVRYYLALAAALYSMKYVLRRQWIRFVLLILLGSTFHKSLLVVIPLYVLAAHAWKKWQLAMAAIFCTTFLFCQDFYLKVVVLLYPTYEDTEYLEGGTSYINILRCLAVLVFAGIVYFMQGRDRRLPTADAMRESEKVHGDDGRHGSGEVHGSDERHGNGEVHGSDERHGNGEVHGSGERHGNGEVHGSNERHEDGKTEIKDTDRVMNLADDRRFWFYFYLNLGALVLYVFCSFLPIISRIGYYLTVSHILFLPMMLRQVGSVKWRKLFRLGILLAAILYFIIYMSRADNDGTLILPYQTFFFHDMVNILSDVN